MSKVVKVIFALIGLLAIGLILVVVTYPLTVPQIDITNSAPEISEEQAKQIGYDAQEVLSCIDVDGCSISPDGRYEIEFNPVDDRGWIEKLVGSGYEFNGLTQVIVVDKMAEIPPKEVAVLRESNPGSGRSYNVFWSSNSRYVVISGTVRAGENEYDPGFEQVRYIFTIDEGKLYSR